MKDQMAELHNSLKLVDQQKKSTVKATKEEERKMAEVAIDKLKSKHENALVNVED